MTYEGLRSSVARRGLGTALGAAIIALAGNAYANKYGELHITSNRVLTDHQYGSVVFDRDNISLDCNGYQVHISSYSKPNCLPSNGTPTATCGIVAIGKSNITIKNCRVVGGFDYGVNLDGTNSATLSTVQASAGTGFYIRNATYTSAYGMLASGSAHDGIDLSNDYYGSYAATVQNVGGDGISAANSQGTFFDQPTISGTGGYGISMYYSTNMGISGGDVRQANLLGIQLSQSNHITIDSTTCVANGGGTDTVYDGVNDGKGINLVKVTASTFSNNRLSNNVLPCDAASGPDSYNNTWPGTYFGIACLYKEPR